MEKEIDIVANSAMVEYIEGLYFRFKSLEMVMKLQYIPSQYVEINNETKEFYLNKFHEARVEYQLAMDELKTLYFPEAGKNDTIAVDFELQRVTLQKHNCNCGGSCSL